jgi:NADH:ubiquinone reductase (H+-translocating)
MGQQSHLMTMPEIKIPVSATRPAEDVTKGICRQHVVVLGAGFGGLTFAKRFPDDLARITVIDRANHHLFQPLLYQVAAAGLAVPDIAQPVRSILAQKRSVTVLMEEVKSIDLADRRVILSGVRLAYDYLVLALGGRTSYFGHPEWESHASGLKSIDDALRIRREVLQAFERAEMEDDAAERRRLMTIVVIGGGPTGVELAGTFAELQRHVLARDFRRVNPAAGRVILIEGGPRLLPSFPPALSAKTRMQLESLGVIVRLGTPVKDLRPQEVVLDGETLSAANIIWAAGVSASPITSGLGSALDRAGRVRVQPDLTLPGRPEVFAIGDLAAAIDVRGVIVPAISPAAIQMGAYAARMIAPELRAGSSPGGSGRPPFVYRDRGTMATIGRSRAVAKIHRLELSGPLAWLLWLCVHLLFLIGFRNKVSVLVQWIYSYLTYKRGARVIYGQLSVTTAAQADRPKASEIANHLRKAGP